MIDGSTQLKRSGWSWWYLLFAIQFAIALWPPFYNKVEPYWTGIPFFYWFQLLLVLIGAVLTAVVYFATEDYHHDVLLDSNPKNVADK